MREAHLRLRAKGTGSIFRAPKGRHGWRAKGPRVDGKVEHLGHFDTYREAEKAIEAFVSGKKVA
jgi:hypothetical protein